MALEDETPRLGCGRPIDELWEVIEAPPDAHERNCADCRHARVALYHLAGLTEAMRAREPHQRQLQPSARVKETIMTVARAEIRRSHRIQLASTQAGSIALSAQALAALTRFAADTIDGVRARRCTIEPFTGTTTAKTTTVDSSEIRISLKVAVSSALSIPPTMVTLRERVTAMLSAQAGLMSRQINIKVEDLYDA